MTGTILGAISTRDSLNSARRQVAKLLECCEEKLIIEISSQAERFGMCMTSLAIIGRRIDDLSVSASTFSREIQLLLLQMEIQETNIKDKTNRLNIVLSAIEKVHSIHEFLEFSRQLQFFLDNADFSEATIILDKQQLLIGNYLKGITALQSATEEANELISAISKMNIQHSHLK